MDMTTLEWGDARLQIEQHVDVDNLLVVNEADYEQSLWWVEDSVVDMLDEREKSLTLSGPSIDDIRWYGTVDGEKWFETGMSYRSEVSTYLKAKCVGTRIVKGGMAE